MELGSYEMAAKLSLWLRGTTPSDALLDAAAGPGKLDTADGAVATATTMLGEATATAVMRQFHGELLHFDRAGNPQYRERVMNEPGLTHLSVSVDDVDGLLVRVPEYGGEVLADTNIGFGVFIRDPDGQLVEILPMSYRRALDDASS